MENDKLKIDVKVQEITASEMWRLIGKQAGASEEQVENLVRAMTAARNEKDDRGEIDDDIDDEIDEDECGSEDEDESENSETYSKEKYVERIEEMIGEIDCYGRTGDSIEGTLDIFAISVNVLTQYILEKELYQIKNRKGK